MKVIGALFGLLLILVIGLIAAFGDQRTRTVYLAPEPSSGWKVPAPIPPSKISAQSQTACEVAQLYPGQCWLFPATTMQPSRLEYQDGNVRILIVATDLMGPDRSRSGYWPGYSPTDLKGKILLHVTVWNKRPTAKMALGDAHIRCADAKGPLKAKRIQYRKYTQGRVLPVGSFELPEIPGLEVGALLIDASPVKTARCVLSLGASPGGSFGTPVPELRLRAVPVAYYLIMF